MRARIHGRRCPLPGGHGTNTIDGVRENPYNNTHTADPNLNRRWEDSIQSLGDRWGRRDVLRLWTPSTFAQAGMLVSDTATEAACTRCPASTTSAARSWSAMPRTGASTAADRGGAWRRRLRVASRNRPFEQYHRCQHAHLPRGEHVPAVPVRILVNASKNIRLRNIHCYSDSKASFDHSVFDGRTSRPAPARICLMDISGNPPATRAKPIPSVVPRLQSQRLAGGFYNISGIAVALRRRVLRRSSLAKILRWSAADRRVSVVRDSPLDPVNLAFDKAGNLLVVSYAGRGVVYAFSPDKPGLDVQVLKAEPSAPRAA